MRQAQGTRRMPYPHEMLKVLRTQYDVGMSEILVMVHLSLTSTAYVPTQIEMADMLVMHRRNVHKTLKKLQDKGILWQDGRKKRFGEGKRAAVNYEFTTEFMAKVLQAKDGLTDEQALQLARSEQAFMDLNYEGETDEQ